jgi:hypothetical protein
VSHQQTFTMDNNSVFLGNFITENGNIWALLSDGEWHAVSALAAAAGKSESSRGFHNLMTNLKKRGLLESGRINGNRSVKLSFII